MRNSARREHAKIYSDVPIILSDNTIYNMYCQKKWRWKIGESGYYYYYFVFCVFMYLVKTFFMCVVIIVYRRGRAWHIILKYVYLRESFVSLYIYKAASMFTAFIFPFGFPSVNVYKSQLRSRTYFVCVRRIKLLIPFNEPPWGSLLYKNCCPFIASSCALATQS